MIINGPSNIDTGNKFFSFCVVGEDTPDLKYKGERTTLEVEKTILLGNFVKFIEVLVQILVTQK